mgnify:CR=1 FL=1
MSRSSGEHVIGCILCSLICGERQKRYVLAKLTRIAKAEGRYPDIRYRRTHELVRNWDLDLVQEGATLSGIAALHGLDVATLREMLGKNF